MGDRETKKQLCCPAMYYPTICQDRYLGAQCGSGEKPSKRGKWLCDAQGGLEGVCLWWKDVLVLTLDPQNHVSQLSDLVVHCLNCINENMLTCYYYCITSQLPKC